MKDLQDPQVFVENQGHQAAPALCPKETQDQLAFLVYQDVREIKASQDLLDFQTIQVLPDPEVRKVPVVQGVLRDSKVHKVFLDPKVARENQAQWGVEVQKVPVGIPSVESQDWRPLDSQDYVVPQDLWDS